MDVELEQDGGMISMAAALCGSGALEAEGSKVKAFDEQVHEAHGIVIVDLIVQAFGKQGDPAAFFLFHEPFHNVLPRRLRYLH
jgi:hypothetical protein